MAVIPDAPGTDLKPNPMTADSGAEFVQLMRELRIWAGQPSYRVLSDRAQENLPISSLWGALKGSKLPKQELVVTFVRACGGTEDDVSRWVTAWRKIALQANGEGAADSVAHKENKYVDVPDKGPQPYLIPSGRWIL